MIEYTLSKQQNDKTVDNYHKTKANNWFEWMKETYSGIITIKNAATHNPTIVFEDGKYLTWFLLKINDE